MGDIVDILSGWVLAFILVGLVIGSYSFRRFPLVGSWFRWTLGGYCVIMLLDFVAVFYGYVQTPWYFFPRRILARLVIAWGIWYCFLYQAYWGRPEG